MASIQTDMPPSGAPAAAQVYGEAELLDLCQQGVRQALQAGADQAEVFASSERELEVGFEKNDLNLARVATETTLGIRVLVQGRLGFATSNRPEDLGEIAAEAVTLAKASLADPLNGLPDPQPIPQRTTELDPDLLALDPQTLTRWGSELLDRVRSQDSRITIDSGGLGLSESVVGVVSSQGIEASHHGAQLGGSLFGMAVDGDQVGSFAYDGDRVQRVDRVLPQLQVAFDRFVSKCLGALGAGQGESFRGPIILPPQVVGSFLGSLLRVLGADAVRQGKSPLAGKLGQVIGSPLLTLIEAGAGLPDFPLAPFDREGIPRQITPLIHEGILCNYLYNGYEARAAGVPSNGHATGRAGSVPGVGPACVQLKPGQTLLADLYGMDRAILVTRLSDSVNPITGDFSGVVKGGFLLKGGERRPIQETTIAGNLYDCLQSISAISQEVTVLGGTRSFPTLRIEDVSVTAG